MQEGRVRAHDRGIDLGIDQFVMKSFQQLVDNPIVWNVSNVGATVV